MEASVLRVKYTPAELSFTSTFFGEHDFQLHVKRTGRLCGEIDLLRELAKASTSTVSVYTPG